MSNMTLKEAKKHTRQLIKNYRLIENQMTDEVILIEADDYTDVAYLNNEVDETYLYDKHGGLTLCDNVYAEPGACVVIPASGDKDGRFDDCPRIVVGGEEYINITEYTDFGYAKLTKIEHGINCDEIAFDQTDDDYGWKTKMLITAERETEHEADYAGRQPWTYLYRGTDSKGRSICIRETCPFFSDEHRSSFEVVK